jgi:hypothetical protein
VLANTFTLTAGFGNQQLWHAANVAVSNSASMLVATAADTTAKFLGCE